ncbi:hypothetical protein RD792_005651, partial [Penstemon davidsonii]
TEVEEKKVPNSEKVLILDGGFVVPHANTFGHSFRDYDAENERQEGVEIFYKTNHINQSYDFVKKMREEYKKMDEVEMSIWECCELLNEVVDESDPDLDEPQIEHLLQTAEAVRKDYPDEDWLHLTALVHDLGKVLLLPSFGELPQWAVVGDTYPVGCAFDESIVHHKYFKENSDYHNPTCNTKCGVYEEGCGLDNVMMSWGHDDYMYLVAKENKSTLPSAGLFIIRYHSFYALHRSGAYKHLMNEEDVENLKWLQIFNKYDLYSKSKVRIDVEKVKPYYLSLIQKGEKKIQIGIQKVEMVYKKMHELVEEVDFLVKEVMEIKKSREFVSGSSRLAASGKSTFVGFDEDLMEIKGKLCGESSKLNVISLVGMGGIGKTTLARNIFDDSLITYHFHTRVWITISQKYYVREILLSILKSMNPITEKLSQEMEEEVIAEYVYKRLKGMRYLIVLDDMWSTQAWDDLKWVFSDDDNGSRIVLTTRLFDLAVYTNSFGHQMGFLNEDQSWKLLNEKVFEEEYCPLYLEEIGKLIAKNCQGLPLAIVVVAGLLSMAKRNEYHWENIAQNLDLRYWRLDNTHFPSLEKLRISHCSGLEEIPSEIGDISPLQVIEVDYSDLAADSAEVILEEQQNLGNDVLQVRLGLHWE